jgi:hypothetical protein
MLTAQNVAAVLRAMMLTNAQPVGVIKSLVSVAS